MFEPLGRIHEQRSPRYINFQPYTNMVIMMTSNTGMTLASLTLGLWNFYAVLVAPVHAMNTWENGALTPPSLVLSIVWRWVVSFMSHTLYSWVKSPWYPLNRRLDGHQNPSGHFREEKNLITHTWNWTTICCLSSPQPGCCTEYAILAAPLMLNLC